MCDRENETVETCGLKRFFVHVCMRANKKKNVWEEWVEITGTDTRGAKINLIHSVFLIALQTSVTHLTEFQEKVQVARRLTPVIR